MSERHHSFQHFNIHTRYCKPRVRLQILLTSWAKGLVLERSWHRAELHPLQWWPYRVGVIPLRRAEKRPSRSCRSYCGSFLTRHPRRSLSGTIARRQPQSSGPHGEIADEIPYKADDLDDSRKQSEDRAMKLVTWFSNAAVS